MNPMPMTWAMEWAIHNLSQALPGVSYFTPGFSPSVGQVKYGGRRPRLAAVLECREPKRHIHNGNRLVTDQHSGLRGTADRAGFAPALRHRGDRLFVLSHTAFSHENV